MDNSFSSMRLVYKLIYYLCSDRIIYLEYVRILLGNFLTNKVLEYV